MNMNTLIADADFDIRMFNAIKRTFPGVTTLGDLKNAMEANHNPRNFGEKTLAKVKEVLKLAETGETRIEEAPGNYMSDTSKYAYTVHAQIVLGAKMVEDGLYQMAKGFKIMRDEKLYKELGYKSFEEYCKTETGFERSMVYKCINIVERMPEKFVESIQQIGVAKLSLLSTLTDEQRDKITENTDLENTSVKELKRQIDELTGKNKKLSEENQELMTECDDIRNERDYFENELDDLKEEKRELELENKNLRDKPVETVTVPSDPKESEEYKKLEHEYDTLENAYMSRKEEIQKLKYEKLGLEEQLHKKTGELNNEEFERRIAEISAQFTTSAERQIAENNKANDALLRDRTEGMQAKIDVLTDKLADSENRVKELEEHIGERRMQGYFLPIDIDTFAELCEYCKDSKFADILYTAKLIKS